MGVGRGKKRGWRGLGGEAPIQALGTFLSLNLRLVLFVLQNQFPTVRAEG